MSSKPVAQVSRKSLAIKRADGEPLTRCDIQYDLLKAIFEDDHAVFTDPHETLHGEPAGTKVSFHDLYINSIMRSSKATKVLKEKMQDVPNFATDFAMLALLTNVGRINTTMSFFPEMKTTIRTYHPIPALQRTNGNLQDAPRIKHILKACTLDDGDNKNPPSTPSDILARARAGQIPSTTVTNLIFVMANHSVPLGQTYFVDDLEFLDVFLAMQISSASRARAFLWLCYHYLESPNIDADDDYDTDGSTPPNPFADHHRDPGKLPLLIRLSPEEAAEENQDTETEKLLAEKLVHQRSEIIKTHGHKAVTSDVVPEEDHEAISVSDAKPREKRATSTAGALARTAAAKEKKAAADKMRRERMKQAKLERASAASFDEQFDSILPESLQQHMQPRPPQLDAQPTPRRILSPPSQTRNPQWTGKVTSNRRRSGRMSPLPARDPRAPPAPQRSILQQTWHVLTHGDPLIDSDEEFADEHIRHDYLQRLDVLSRIQPMRTEEDYNLHPKISDSRSRVIPH